MPDTIHPVTGEVLKDDPSYPAYAFGPENGQAGLVGPTGVNATCAVLSMAGSNTYYARVVPSRRMRITKIRFRLMTAAGADDAVSVAIMNSVGQKMASRDFITGLLNGATGYKDVSFTDPVTLEAGKIYYFALATTAPGGTAAQLLSVNPGAAERWALFGTTPGTADAMLRAAGVIEADMSLAVMPAANIPLMAGLEN